MVRRCPWILQFVCALVLLTNECAHVFAEDDSSSGSDTCPANRDIFTRTTFIKRVMGYASDSYLTSPIRRPGDQNDEPAEDDGTTSDAGEHSVDSDDEHDHLDIDSPDEDDAMTRLKNVFSKHRQKPYTREEFTEKLREILITPDPLYGTEYNKDWGRACMTTDYEIPNTEDLIHFNVFDPFMPPGLLFEDLRCLHLYNVQPEYHLYKVRMGDMVLTLRPDLEDASLHLFEDSWGLMVVRVLFTVDGVLHRYEYTENSRGSRVFHKTMGPAMHYAAPNTDTTDLNKWLDEKYYALSRRRPPIIEEVLTAAKA
ncbi:membrane protein, putative [Babesia bigemina]|uniref:Membrane protein, putative n=1 Tax=Babesia bigemina TaxID=5866 RepID=A0A061D2F2_BABBI|nr:membrane protein, putative [Babesia bigemina]CDR94946.1 membrane protein, putative [Babesia bigemina]|eukprot:XP_012767132.1 membrane protein, putative [Babesia bigemina]